jgi:putative Ca2+/H+ antiporter (TMEM165/GDT1 family)
MRKYAKDYEIGTERDKRGREKRVAIYIGKLFDVSLDEKGLKKFRRISLLLLGLVFITQVAGGFVSNLGMYAFFVSLPYVGVYLPVYFLAMGVFRLPDKKWKYRREEVELSFKRIKTFSTVLLILAALGTLGEMVFMIWFANGMIGREWIYLGLEVLLVALSAIWVYIQRDIEIIQIKEEAVGVAVEVESEVEDEEA